MSLDSTDDENWLANHLSLGENGILSNPLNPMPPFLKRVEGIEKLRRSLAKELSSPNSVRDKSSNLPHLLSIVKCVWQTTKANNEDEDDDGNGDDDSDSPDKHYNGVLSKCPSAVLKPFVYSQGKTGRLLVDIVSASGNIWYKISARNPKSLALVASGCGGFGKKSIIDHALDYIQCAEENLCLFKPPKVVVIFTSGISEQVATELESIGAAVIGRRIEDEVLQLHPRIKVLQECDTKLLQTSANTPPGESVQEEEVDEEDGDEFRFGLVNPNLDGVERLNLDISTLLAYTSNLTNGHEHVKFKKKILSDQADAELVRPQKPILDRIFEGKSLFCCETAMKDFQFIVSTVGGEDEKVRAKQFISERVTIVPDQVTEKAAALTVAGNIKKRSVIIFSTGEAIKAVTVTSNSGFVRSARSQGVDFPSYIHESRALTEQKETSGEHTL